MRRLVEEQRLPGVATLIARLVRIGQIPRAVRESEGTIAIVPQPPAP